MARGRPTAEHRSEPNATHTSAPAGAWILKGSQACGRLPCKMQQATTRRSMQCAGAVFMIEPASFSFNEQTAASNAMQQSGEASLGSEDLMAAGRTESQRL